MLHDTLDMWFGENPITRKQLVVISDGMGQDTQAIGVMACEEPDRFKQVLGIPIEQEIIVISVHAETGNEHPETIAQREWKQELYAKHGIISFIITPDMGYHKGFWQSLTHMYEAKNAIGSKAYPKTCTDNLKIKVIYRFLEDWLSANFNVKSHRKQGFYSYSEIFGKIIVVMGIEFHEAKRRLRGNMQLPKWMRDNFIFKNPLVTLEWDRAELQEYIRSRGHEVCYPSNCMFCPFMSEEELLWLMKKYPDFYAWWCKMEQKKIDHFKYERYYCYDCKKGVDTEDNFCIKFYCNKCGIASSKDTCRKCQSKDLRYCGKLATLGYPDKINFGVWGRVRKDKSTGEYYALTLPMVVANSKHKNKSFEELDEYKRSHGHCVMSSW